MGPRILLPHFVQESLDDEFNELLGPADGQVPPLPLKGSPRILCDLSRFRKELISPLVVGHSVISSPGRQSGLSSQYQLPSGR